LILNESKSKIFFYDAGVKQFISGIFYYKKAQKELQITQIKFVFSTKIEIKKTLSVYRRDSKKS